MARTALSIGSLAMAAVLLTNAPAVAESHLDAMITGYECSASFAGIVQGLPCSGNTVSGVGTRMGDYVQISATVQYHYDDDGLPVPQIDPLRPVEYERGILSLDAMFVFTPTGCLPRPCIWPSVSRSTSEPLVFGSNDMPDDISGEVTLVARQTLGYLASGPYEATGAGMTVWVRGVNAQVISAPVPEPGSYALMLAGLAALGIVAKRGALPRGLGSRRGRQVAV